MKNNNLNKRLPQYKAPDNAWQAIENNLDSLDRNKDSNIKLSEFKAPESIWNKLESELNVLEENTINTNLKNKLPKYQYDSKLALFANQKLKKQWIHIAASIIILASIGSAILYNTLKSKETISYSITEVIIDNSNYDLQEITFNSGFENLLNQFCNEKPQICQNQDYQILSKQLEQIKAEEQNLKTIQAQHKDPNINKMILQLQNDKVQLEKTLLTLF